jgi:outer membrane immunogenic protein
MKNRGYLLATASGVGALAAASGAHAADMGLPAKAPLPPPPAASWAGWYVGLNAGANWQHAVNTGGPLSLSTAVTTATGFIGGGQIGYNWQSGNFVYGLEGDIDGLTGKGTDFITKGPSTIGFSNRITWLSTIRGRAGLAIGDTMAYVTGGVAVGGVENSSSFTVNSISDVHFLSENQARVGWTIGGGVEHMLTPNWVFGLEALFVDLGDHAVTNTFPRTNGSETKTTRFSNQAVIGRARVSYKW